jgi:transposase
MMGRQTVDQSQLFYLFNLEKRIPERHLLRRINPTVTRILGEFREKLQPFYSEIGRPSIDPELMIRMLIVGYCYGIRCERKLCEEVELHLAYRWFCRLDLDDKVPDHSTFSVNRHGRFRDSDLFRQVFEAVVRACMDAGLVKGEAFAVDASVMEADASRYHGKAPDDIDWSVPERQTRAVAEFLGAVDDEDAGADEPAEELARAVRGMPRMSPQAAMLSKHPLAQGHTRRQRRCPRSCSFLHWYPGVRQITRRAQEGRDALCTPEDPPWF